MKKRSYRRISIKDVDAGKLLEQLASRVVVLAIDVAKVDMVAAVGCAGGEVVKTVSWKHPSESALFFGLVELLQQVGKEVVAVMEPSGTYGDALRYQLQRRGVATYRVGSKRTHDAAEVYDSVPSMHDAKAAAIVFRLHGEGLSTRWEPADERSRELRAALSTLELYREHYHRNLNVLEAVLARHWPELTAVVELTSASLLVLLSEVGGPEEVASSADVAKEVLRRASRGLLKREKVAQVVESARTTLGEPLLESEKRMLRELAGELHRGHEHLNRAQKRVEQLSDRREELREVARAVGKVTAVVLHSEVGDARDFSSAAAYAKAAGLNLKERSSGKHKGQLGLTKRGPSRARKYLWFAVLRLIQSDSIVRAWYRSKVARDGGKKMRALGALMRKVVKALYHVGRGEPLDTRKLFDVTRLELSA